MSLVVMAEQDDQCNPWPALAPIRTSNKYTEGCNIKHQNSASRSSQKLLDLQSFQSPSSASSTISLLHNSSSSLSSSSKSTNLFTKCFIPIPSSSSAICRVSITNDTLVRRSQNQRAAAPVATSVTSPASTAAAAALSHHVLLTHCSSAKSASHGHGSFTIIPINVVGKKKSPGYVSDEPTSPEVNCIGRVRSGNNNCNAWDALTSNEADKSKSSKKKQRSSTPRGRRRQIQDLVPKMIVPRPLPQPSSSSSSSSLINGWRRCVNLFKDGLTFPRELSRRIRRDDTMIDRLCRAGTGCSHSSVARRRQIGGPGPKQGSALSNISAISRSVDDNKIDSSSSSSSCSSTPHLDNIHGNVALADQASAPLPSANCLLLVRSGSRNRVFHSCDDDHNDVDSDHDNIIRSQNDHISPSIHYNPISDHTQNAINSDFHHKTMLKSLFHTSDQDHQIIKRSNVVNESDPKSRISIKGNKFASFRSLLKR